MFPLDRPPSSIASAVGCPTLFGDFAGTMGLSDFPTLLITGVRPWAFPVRPTSPSVVGDVGISRFSRKKVAHVLRVFDRAGPLEGSRYLVLE